MDEIWKDIKGYEGTYKVSNFGNIISFKRQNPKLLTKVINSDRYYVVNLTKDGKTKLFTVHKLVLGAFIPNEKNLPVINHKDENKLNNNINNLEWCTYEYNHNYGSRNLRTGISQRNRKDSKKVIQYDLKMNFIREWPSLGEIQRTFGYPTSNISKCCKGKSKLAYGYIWKFK
jgi:hypothetical protein